MIAPLGIRITFRIAAAVSAVSCVLYFIINRFFFHKQQLERKKNSKTPQTNREEIDVESNVVENTSTKDTPSDMGDSKVVKRVYSNPAFEKE